MAENDDDKKISLDTEVKLKVSDIYPYMSPDHEIEMFDSILGSLPAEKIAERMLECLSEDEITEIKAAIAEHEQEGGE